MEPTKSLKAYGINEIKRRVVDTPISEAGFIGMGIGASMLGVRPVMELMFYSFHMLPFDQMINNAACVRYMSGGLINCPIVIRGPANGGTNPFSYYRKYFFANVPGLKVVTPSTALDAYGLMKSAIRDNDPVYLMENTLLYGDPLAAGTDQEITIPIGTAEVKREGEDVSLIAHGRCVIVALEAAKKLEEESGIKAEVVDLRSIRPLDEDTILKSVAKTNRVVLVDESKPFCGISSQIATLIQEKAFDDLDAPVKRVTSIDAPAIYSTPVEKEQIPNVSRIVDMVQSLG